MPSSWLHRKRAEPFFARYRDTPALRISDLNSLRWRGSPDQKTGDHFYFYPVSQIIDSVSGPDQEFFSRRLFDDFRVALAAEVLALSLGRWPMNYRSKTLALMQLGKFRRF